MSYFNTSMIVKPADFDFLFLWSPTQLSSLTRSVREQLSHTLSLLSYFRQLPHVARCWLQPVAVRADKASFVRRERATMDSVCVGPPVIGPAFQTQESHPSRLLSNKWLAASELKAFSVVLTKSDLFALVRIQMTWKWSQQRATEENSMFLILKMAWKCRTEAALQDLAGNNLAKKKKNSFPWLKVIKGTTCSVCGEFACSLR